MFFFKKEDPPPPRREYFGTGQTTRQRVFRMVADRLEALGYQCSKNPEEFFLFCPVERAAGRYDIIWRVTDKHVTVVTLSPFTVSGCPREDVVLLCSLANARLLNGTFYADPEGDRVMVSVTQRVFSTLQFGEKTIDYLLETLLARLDCRYMRSLESLCKGYTTLAQELDKLNGEG